MLRRTKFLWALGIVVVLMIAARAAAPFVIKDWLNKKLVALETYDGHVADVDLAIWRGAYAADRVRIVKTGSKQPEPFFDADRVDLSIEWRNLLRGRIVAECKLSNPHVNLIRADSEAQSQLGTEVDWADELEKLSPFKFNTIVVEDGTATFRAPGIRSKDALQARNIFGAITNMTNVARSGQATFAGFKASATVLDSGSAVVIGSANPLAHSPTFDVNLTVKNVQLPKVNPWLRQYIKADAEAGDFELYTELAAADGKFKGYAKPIMKNVNIYSSEEEEDNPLKRLWEGLVDFAAEILENQDTEQVAARIPFSGTIKNPDASILETVVSVLHNAFIGAFARSLEGSISIRDVKKNLKELKGDDESKDMADKKEGA